MSMIKWKSRPSTGMSHWGDRWFGSVNGVIFFIIEFEKEPYEEDHYNLNCRLPSKQSRYYGKIKTLDKAKKKSEEELTEWLDRAGLTFKERNEDTEK